MQSMTGYGRAEYNENGISLVVEIKTVNNRFLDIIPKYPRCFVPMDDFIRKTLQSRLKRGRVELFITYQNSIDSGKTLDLDEGLAEKYVNVAKRLSDKFCTDGTLINDFTISSLMRCSDVVVERTSDTCGEAVIKALEKTLILATENLNAMRNTEGEKLRLDILTHADTVEKITTAIDGRAPMIKGEYEIKIKERMSEILSDVKYDEGRMLQEVALFADKSDIAEELTRLKSHISQLREICCGVEDVGKKLDFLMQEFNREANTICSKSNDIDITKYGLALKNEIEKMREQVQNIE